MISVTTEGSFDKTTKFLEGLTSQKLFRNLDRFGREGVAALSAATPVETSETARSWRYEILKGKSDVTIAWFNDHIEDGVNIAVIIQYGHGTGTGGFVQGRDYINPVIQPIFDRIRDDVWRQVTSG
jgi:hypothetical protein